MDPAGDVPGQSASERVNEAKADRHRELLMSGAIVPHERPRGRPRKDVVTIGASA